VYGSNTSRDTNLRHFKSFIIPQIFLGTILYTYYGILKTALLHFQHLKIKRFDFEQVYEYVYYSVVPSFKDLYTLIKKYPPPHFIC